MRLCWLALIVTLHTPAAAGETLVAARTLRAQTILSAADMALSNTTVPGAASELAETVGLETRVTIYQGQPMLAKSLGPPTLVARNQAVTLIFRNGILNIFAEGRALARGGIGDRIRVMNITSRTTVTGIIAPDGTVSVTVSN